MITGYAGFIGSNLTRMLMSDADTVLGLDCHTYASRPHWVWETFRSEEERFVEANVDLRDFKSLRATIEHFRPDAVYHLAAESHVCKSIAGPRAFAETNFMGTFNLLEALRQTGFSGRMLHVSTDEAFGELQHWQSPFEETTAIDPRSPYSASKAASDLMVRAYVRTYGLDAVITRCTNNFGPNQHEEKLIPRAITRLMANQPMTLHGDGTHSRDWIHVDDHCRALYSVMRSGIRGEMYCVGSGLELPNWKVIDEVAQAMRDEIGWKGEARTVRTGDRPTDDMRYAVSTEKIFEQCGWAVDSGIDYFRRRLRETVRWYWENAP